MEEETKKKRRGRLTMDERKAQLRVFAEKNVARARAKYHAASIAFNKAEKEQAAAEAEMRSLGDSDA